MRRKRARSVNAERELHSLDDARSSVLGGLTRAFMLYSALMNEVGGSVALEVRASTDSIMLVDEELDRRPFPLSSLSPMFLENFLNSRLNFALSVSTIKFCRCQRHQEMVQL
jgi:hypothetical protein